MQKEYRRLSRRTRQLLNQPEGREVEFKREVNAVKHKMLIAFANTSTGGTVLVGVEEMTVPDGVQRGRVVGCDVSDSARLQVQNRALSCIPPINVQIYTENIAHRPILRIEVPSGSNKPYCSKSGEYCIRSDGRIRALQPGELLDLFMEREGAQFVARFRHAVGQLEGQVSTMDNELRHGVDQMLGDMKRLDQDTNFILNELYGRSRAMGEETEAARRHEQSLARRMGQLTKRLEGNQQSLVRRVEQLDLKLDALLARFSIEDPLHRHVREQINQMIAAMPTREKPRLIKDFRRILLQIYPSIGPETLERWIDQALESIEQSQRALAPKLDG